MKPLHQHVLAAALLATFGLAAVAQTQMPPVPATGRNAPEMQAHRGGDPARTEQRRAHMQERMAKRMEAFKQKLKIDAGQEGAWSAWTSALKPSGPRQRPNHAEMAQLTTPERIDRMRARRAERMAEMDKRMEATKTFYTALNADQKKVFDTESMRFLRRGGKGGPGGHRGHHGRG
jgi:periplasmic protein CpxP/Spy